MWDSWNAGLAKMLRLVDTDLPTFFGGGPCMFFFVGNWDMVGNNTPVFFIRDPSKFPGSYIFNSKPMHPNERLLTSKSSMSLDFIHTQKRNPQTNLGDPDMFWDFLSLVPESIHQVTILFSDRGTPDGYRHMNGYSSHTLKLVDGAGKFRYVKWHFKTDQGIKTLTAEQASKLASEDPDYATRDLFNAIAKGEFPSWTVYLQIMEAEDAAKYRFNPFDVTKVWPHKVCVNTFTYYSKKRLLWRREKGDCPKLGQSTRHIQLILYPSTPHRTIPSSRLANSSSTATLRTTLPRPSRLPSRLLT